MKKASRKGWLGFQLEAPTRFELVMEVLQTSALPLGDGAENLPEGVRLQGPVLITNHHTGVKEKTGLNASVFRPVQIVF